MNEIKRQIKLINILINDDAFLQRLCAFLNNNEESVDKVLSLIIMYYLNTLDRRIDYTIEELIERINRKYDQELLYAQVDCCTAKTIKLLGINNSVTEGNLPDNIKKVARAISFDTVGETDSLSFTESLHTAMGDLKPKALYSTLLKEPRDGKKEISVTEPEQRHYESIVKKHITDVTKTTTGALFTESSKIINKYVDSKRHIVVVPKNHASIELGTKIGTYEPLSRISSNNVGLLELPSIYHLKQICLKRRPPKVEPRRKSTKEITPLVSYYRYEPVQITDKFQYETPALTGDADYDIDIIYNGLDRKDSRGKLSSIFDENLKRIKKNPEIIQLTKVGNKYKIENGRHRIVYLTHMYKRMTESKTSGIKPEDFRIPAVVIHRLENPEVNNLLLTIKNRSSHSVFFKDNINDDNENIIIIMDNKVYRVGNIDELKEFVYSTHQDKYFIGNQKELSINYEFFIHKIIYILKGEHSHLSFYDIARIIKQYGVKYDGELIKTDTLDYRELYRAYMNVIVTLDKNKTFYPDRTELQELEHKMALFDLSREIIRFINNYPENLELKELELVQRLREDNRFAKYDELYLNRVINYYRLDVILANRNKRIPKV